MRLKRKRQKQKNTLWINGESGARGRKKTVERQKKPKGRKEIDPTLAKDVIWSTFSVSSAPN